MSDDVRMADEEQDEILNRAYGVEQAEFVRPSDAEPARPPEQCQECGSPDVRRVHKLPSYVLFLALLVGIGLATDQMMAAFLIAIAGSIFVLIAPRWRCGSCGYRW
jgi:hypothetical protein